MAKCTTCHEPIPTELRLSDQERAELDKETDKARARARARELNHEIPKQLRSHRMDRLIERSEDANRRLNDIDNDKKKES